MEDKRAYFTNMTLQEIKSLAPKATEIKLEMELIKDLRLLGDDVTEMALVLQRKLKSKPPLEEWNTVLTVQNTIDLLLKYAND